MNFIIIQSHAISGTGKDVRDLLNRLTTNDLRDLENHPDGKMSILTNEKGRIIDVLTIFPTEDGVLMFSESSQWEKTLQWLEAHVIMDDARFARTKSQFSKVVTYHDTFDSSQTNSQNAANSWIINAKQLYASFNAYVNISAISMREQLLQAWIVNNECEQIRRVLSERGGKEKSAAEFDIDAIQRGIARVDRELTLEFNPREAGLQDLVSEVKGCYIGQEVIARLKTYDKVQRSLCKFLINKELPSIPFELHVQDSSSIWVTSAGPLEENLVCLGYVPRSLATVNKHILTSNGIGVRVIENLTERA